MKTTEHFKNTIKAYLDQRAATDVLFSFQYSKPEKNIDDCITYILNTVKKSGCCGFADDEIYSMAVHYYDEDVEIGKQINANIVVNHVVELTAEEKEQARQDAIKQAQNEVYRKITQQPAKRTSTAVSTPQPNLFDL